MAQYKVTAKRLIGRHGKRYTAGDLITDEQIFNGHVQMLLENKSIEPIASTPQKQKTKTGSDGADGDSKE